MESVQWPYAPESARVTGKDATLALGALVVSWPGGLCSADLPGIARAPLMASVPLGVAHILRRLWQIPSSLHPTGHLASAADGKDLKFR
jgi:hypothetical protein